MTERAESADFRTEGQLDPPSLDDERGMRVLEWLLVGLCLSAVVLLGLLR